ncbi:hypothetical protein BJX66DRAFT_331643 [Aspergillus keveii]|uniref:Uncharacterized protein n=1 Tax=Aspergillus keveii TaxID=714993 RepID=A0ABR4GNP3_9EURO
MSLKICFGWSILEADPDISQGAQVLHPLPFTPPGFVPVMMTRRWKPDEGWLALEPELQPIDLPHTHSLLTLWVPRRLLEANCLPELPTVDVYEGISGNVDALAHTDGFYAAQKHAFEQLGVFPGGVGLFQGLLLRVRPFGLRALHIALPIITHVLREPNQRCQVMLIAPSNNVADHLATSMQEVVNDAHPKQPIMVSAAPPEPGSLPPVLEDVGENGPLLNTFETAVTIAELHAEMKK